MADENQELQQMAQAVRNAMQDLDVATKKASVGIDAFGRELKTVPGQLAKGMGSFAKSVGQGDTSFKSLNSVVDLAANAMAGLAKSIPYAGEGLAAGIKATAEASKFMLEQMDTTTKAFNDLGKVGALTASGMSGLQKQFIASGLQLNTFVKQVSENSVALARFRGLTGDGAEEFSQVAGALTRGTDDSLRRLGMNAEQIGDTVGAFVTQQTRLGRAQNMTTAELTEGAKRYGLELDLLSKVTGMSREAIQKQQDAALSESKFRANYELAMKSGNEEQIRGAKAMMALQTRMQSFGGDLGQGVRDLSAGVAGTDAARKLVNSTGGAALDIMARLKAGAIDQDQAQIELISSMERNQDAQLQIASQVGNTAGVFVETAQMQDAINAKNAGSFEKAKTVQAAQTSGADDLTNTTVKAQKSMEGLNIEIQKLGFTFLPKAATAVSHMTGAMETFVKYVNKTLGAKLDEDARKAREAAAASGSTADMLNVGHYDPDDDAALQSGSAYKAERARLRGGGGAPGGGGGAPGGGGGAPGGGGGGASAEPGANETPVGSGGGKGGPELTTISSKSGKSTQVGKEYGSAFQKLIDYLDGTGYEINSLGGFVDRDVRGKPGQKSVHSMGGAIDINPEANPMGTELITDMPAEIAKVAASLGLGWGGNWKSKKDAMHFSAARSEGGTMLSAANGAILSGPMSGYRPNLTMHGTEAIVPLNSSTANAAGLGTDPGVMMAQLEKMDEMISVLKSQLGVSEKLLRYQS